MSERPPICELFYEISKWAESVGIKDCHTFPGLFHAELDTEDGDVLSLALNAHPEETTEENLTVPPYHCAITSQKYLAVAIVGPFGGVMGGFMEDKLIAAFRDGAGRGHTLTKLGGDDIPAEVPAQEGNADPA